MSQTEVRHIQEHFEQMFAEGTTPWTQHGMEPQISQLADWLLKEMQEPVVLDIGCGNGWVAIYFASRGIKTFGIDSSPTAIGEAREAAQKAGLDKRTFFAVGNGLDLPYEDANFAAIFDRGFFHHVPEDEYERYISETTRVLKPNGLLSLQAFTKRNQCMKHEFSADDIVRIFGSRFALLEHSEDPWPTSAPAHLGHYLLRKSRPR